MTNLTPTQILALKTLADNGDMTYGMLADAGVNITTGEMSKGTISANGEAANPDSLEARGYVKWQEMSEGEGKGKLWTVTASGRKMADKLVLRVRDNGEKVPAGMLDKAVLRVKGTRHYGLELFTEEDMTTVRSLLSEKYHNVPLDGLRQQMVNRRKQGAYSDPLEKQRKAMERAIREFGPEGTVIEGLLSAKQVNALREQIDIIASQSQTA